MVVSDCVLMSMWLFQIVSCCPCGCFRLCPNVRVVVSDCVLMSMWLFQSTLSANMFRLVDADEDTDVQKFMVLLRNIDAMTVVCLHTQDLQVKHC